MSEFPPAPASADPPTDLVPSTASPKRPWTILGRLSKAVREQNWFAVGLEFVIVVLGVVIGFQVTAWGQARADRAAEQRYLYHLQADLVETERHLREIESLMAPQAVAGTRLVRAFFLPEEPPADSLMAWLTKTWSTFHIRPIMATMETLVVTGDLGLIGNDSLRSAITAHLEIMDVAMRLQVDLQTRWQEHFALLVRRFNPIELNTSWRSPQQLAAAREDPLWPYPEEARTDRFPFDAGAFLNNRAAFHEADGMRNARRQMITSRRWILRQTTALREQIEAELNR